MLFHNNMGLILLDTPSSQCYPSTVFSPGHTQIQSLLWTMPQSTKLRASGRWSRNAACSLFIYHQIHLIWTPSKRHFHPSRHGCMPIATTWAGRCRKMHTLLFRRQFTASPRMTHMGGTSTASTSCSHNSYSTTVFCNPMYAAPSKNDCFKLGYTMGANSVEFVPSSWILFYFIFFLLLNSLQFHLGSFNIHLGHVWKKYRDNIMRIKGWDW